MNQGAESHSKQADPQGDFKDNFVWNKLARVATKKRNIRSFILQFLCGFLYFKILFNGL